MVHITRSEDVIMTTIGLEKNGKGKVQLVIDKRTGLVKKLIEGFESKGITTVEVEPDLYSKLNAGARSIVSDTKPEVQALINDLYKENEKTTGFISKIYNKICKIIPKIFISRS